MKCRSESMERIQVGKSYCNLHMSTATLNWAVPDSFLETTVQMLECELFHADLANCG